MAVASKYVTRNEFEPVKTGVERLTIRMEVFAQDLHSLTLQVADLADNVDLRLDRLEGRMDGLEGRMERLEGRMDRIEGRMDRLEERMDRLEKAVVDLTKTVVDGNAAIMSALLRMAPRS